jgi:hypothetical protein
MNLLAGNSRHDDGGLLAKWILGEGLGLQGHACNKFTGSRFGESCLLVCPEYRIWERTQGSV